MTSGRNRFRAVQGYQQVLVNARQKTVHAEVLSRENLTSVIRYGFGVTEV